MKIDAADLALQDSSHLMTDIVVPRPIAWVSTVDKNGVYNLAPFSCYGLVSQSTNGSRFFCWLLLRGEKERI